MTLKLRRCLGQRQGHTQLDWHAPITPKKYSRATRQVYDLRCKTSSSDGSHHEDSPAESITRFEANARNTSQLAPMVPDMIQLAFIRCDPDYEPFVQEIWHDTITRGWPRVITHRSAREAKLAIQEMVDLVAVDDLAYYIYLCGGIIGYAAARQDVVGPRALPRLFYKMKIRALRDLRSEIEKLGDGLPSDTLLFVILAFAIQESFCNADAANEGPSWRKSPLAHAQMLSWIGPLHNNSRHIAVFH